MKPLIILLVIAFCSGCASTSKAPDRPVVEACDLIQTSGMDCISISTIRDYTPLTDSHVILWATGRPYLVRLFSPSSDLKTGFRLSFSSRDDQLCPYGGDEIVFDGIGFPGGQRIASIKRLTKDQAESLKACYGGGKDETPPEPREVEGAKVEELGKTESN
jgi:hypothetical protein